MNAVITQSKYQDGEGLAGQTSCSYTLIISASAYTYQEEDGIEEAVDKEDGTNKLPFYVQQILYGAVHQQVMILTLNNSGKHGWCPVLRRKIIL